MPQFNINPDSRVYSAVLRAVSELVEHYDQDDNARQVEFRISSDPFNVHFKLTVRPRSELVTIFSVLQFTVPEENRAAYATKVCQLNFDEMYAGTFDFNPETGLTVFRVPVLYGKSQISHELFKDAIQLVFKTVNQFNDTLYRASRGE